MQQVHRRPYLLNLPHPPYPTPSVQLLKLEYHFWKLLLSLRLFQPFRVKLFVSWGLLSVVAVNSFPLSGAISDFFWDACDILVYPCLCSFLMLIAANEDPEWILVEKDRFMNDYWQRCWWQTWPTELLSWVVPNNQGIAQEEVSITEWLSSPDLCYYSKGDSES